MKKLILFFVALTFSVAAMAQQKNCYVYSQKIFQSMPEYNEAIQNIEEFAQLAKSKSERLLKDVKKMFDEYREYERDLTPAQRSKFKQRIIIKEKEANDYEKSIFGEDGELSKRQKALMEPVERKVLTVINAFAKKGNYDMIFDLSLTKVAIYQSPKLDVTDLIIEEIKKYNYK